MPCMTYMCDTPLLQRPPLATLTQYAWGPPAEVRVHACRCDPSPAELLIAPVLAELPPAHYVILYNYYVAMLRITCTLLVREVQYDALPTYHSNRCAIKNNKCAEIYIAYNVLALKVSTMR